MSKKIILKQFRIKFRPPFGEIEPLQITKY